MPAELEWTEYIVSRLCGEIAGGRAVHDVCTEPWCPSEPTIYRKMATDHEFRALIDAARAAQQDYEADACVKMADKATTEDWQVVKLRIWARQWRAAKLAPKKYGDKLGLEHTGKDGGPIETAHSFKDVPTDKLIDILKGGDE